MESKLEREGIDAFVRDKRSLGKYMHELIHSSMDYLADAAHDHIGMFVLAPTDTRFHDALNICTGKCTGKGKGKGTGNKVKAYWYFVSEYIKLLGKSSRNRCLIGRVRGTLADLQYMAEVVGYAIKDTNR